MKILGITGGVGSGKSRILYDLKKNYDAYVVEADKLAHELMEPGMDVYQAVARHFGTDILSEEPPYKIDRGRLGTIVFNDGKKRKELNEMTHPIVKQHILKLIEEQSRKKQHKLFVIEAALLIQDGYKSICDEIWYVKVDRKERIRRLFEQRGYDEEKCNEIFESQEPDEYYEKYADFTINNQTDYENSAKQINVQLNKFMSDGIIV
ncbi:MAG: dephospho-CoA kinase [Clostridium sp.]|nr:dephospho-CoA kinase [Clostridium sp.]MCM1398728.1 dephospho-CoA kinase [Clostridium sp.]MCM1458640.1 dephospho-CoA kinase [Bacteroides sp.]